MGRLGRRGKAGVTARRPVDERDFWIAISAVIAIGPEHPVVNVLRLALPLGLPAKMIVLFVKMVNTFRLALSLGLPVKMVELSIKMLCEFVAAFPIAAAILLPSEACTSVLSSSN